MTYYGQIINGVIVLNGPVQLPEGTLVKIEPVVPTDKENTRKPRDWKGIYRNHGPVPTEEDIEQIRREAWPE